jgi:regulatory protein
MSDPLYSHAVRLLAQRPQSRAELSSKLMLVCRRRSSAPTAAAGCDVRVRSALARLSEAGLVDDAAFAAWFARERVQHRPRSRMVLRSELFNKGIRRTEADSALAAASFDEDAACLATARRGRATRSGKELERFLASKGYRWATITKVVAADCATAVGEGAEFAAGAEDAAGGLR